MLSLEDMADIANTVEAYRSIVHSMFNDGIQNEGRLIVLLIFTRAVCSRYPHISGEVMTEYRRFVNAFRTERSQLCKLI